MLSLETITRKTDKGLPQYLDAVDSDVFILSGAEDLVPVLAHDANAQRTVDGKTYRIRRYRPRIEGLFARIERWTITADVTDIFWRSIPPCETPDKQAPHVMTKPTRLCRSVGRSAAAAAARTHLA
jgi:hypothetical protein